MNKEQMTKAGRLAFREEGNMWVCYYAEPGTMEGALVLGTIAMGLVSSTEARDAFIEAMRIAAGVVLQETTGCEPVWNDPEPAPEHERSGRA